MLVHVQHRYKFDNQNISTFEDNYRLVSDLAFSIFFDIETTWRKTYNFDERVERHLVFYSIVVTFHPYLCIERIFIQRSFAQPFEELNSVAYLTAEMLHYFDLITAKQLRDCAKNVFEENRKFFREPNVFLRAQIRHRHLQEIVRQKIGSRFRELNHQAEI